MMGKKVKENGDLTKRSRELDKVLADLSIRAASDVNLGQELREYFNKQADRAYLRIKEFDKKSKAKSK